MLEKWERQPQRFGMVVGFIALPLLWLLQDVLLGLTSLRLPPAHQIGGYFSKGALPGVLLGAGISQAVYARNIGDVKQARQCLLFHSAFVLGAIALPHAFLMAFSNLQGMSGRRAIVGEFFSFVIPYWLSVLLAPISSNFPFQCALLMLFVGLLMRARR